MASHTLNLMGLLPSMAPLGAFQSMAVPPPPAAGCYCFPGDACWPSAAAWSAFNATVGGQLIPTTPIASVCHDGPSGAYDADRCGQLQSNWFFPETHLASSSSAMAYLFTNNSCNPFLPRHTLCTLGNYVSYSVQVRDVADAQKTLAFAKKNNIRFVIRNTGHDYNGKSTGAGALAIWTHNLKTIDLVDSYNRPWYKGRAVKFGAGVQSYDAYKFADAHQGTVVGGNCPTVGVAGGLTQGGGHSPLATKFGLAADQVLEWGVLTAAGDLITATPATNGDLYWALCGGGVSTYGIVMSMTVKLYPTVSVASAKMTFATPGTEDGANNYWGGVKTFMESLPDMVDAGLHVIFTVAPGAFSVSPATGVGMTQAAVDALFQPTLTQLAKNSIPYQYQSQRFSTFLQSYQTMNLPSANVSNSVLGGRLLPRSVVDEDIDDFMATVRSIIDANHLFVGIGVDVSKTPANKVAVNPYWRKTLIASVMGTFFDYQNFDANFAKQKFMTNTLIPKLSALAGDPPAAYLNEADFEEPNWQHVFYGDNYAALNSIKSKYDPNDTFYALGAVGSDRWVQRKDGRLCKA